MSPQINILDDIWKLTAWFVKHFPLEVPNAHLEPALLMQNRRNFSVIGELVRFCPRMWCCYCQEYDKAHRENVDPVKDWQEVCKTVDGFYVELLKKQPDAITDTVVGELFQVLPSFLFDVVMNNAGSDWRTLDQSLKDEAPVFYELMRCISSTAHREEQAEFYQGMLAAIRQLEGGVYA